MTKTKTDAKVRWQVRYAQAAEQVDPLLDLLDHWETKPEKDADGKPTSYWQRLAYAALATHKLVEWMKQIEAEGLEEDIEFADPLEADALEADAHNELVKLYSCVDFAIADFGASI